MAISRSLRFRITSLAMIVVFVVLAGIGVFLDRALEDHVLRQVDQDLVSNAQYTRYRIFHQQYLPHHMPAGEFVQVYTATGRLLGQSDSLIIHRPIIHFPGPSATSPAFWTITVPKLGELRVVQYPLGGHPPLTLVEGQQINQAMAACASLSHLLWVVLPLLSVVLALLIWHVVGRAMRRVEAIRASVAHISANELDERVPYSGSGDELDQLAATMNEMLDRLETAVEREHQFVADASHELRSPVAALRAALTEPHDKTRRNRPQLDSALSSLQRLELLTEELLVLEAGGTSSSAKARLVDLDDLLLSQASHLCATSDLTIDVSGVSAGQVVASETDLARVIENLSSNAARHARSTVQFGLHEDGEVVCLTVADDGPGIPEEMRSKVFERFLRLESDRDRSSGGAGLGLAITADLVTRWGGRVSVGACAPTGARLVVELPRAPRSWRVGMHESGPNGITRVNAAAAN